MAEERISISEYARRRGCSHTAVQKAVEAGKIVKGFGRDEKGKPYIIPSLADQEWAENHNPNYERTTRAGGTVLEPPAADSPVAKPKKPATRKAAPAAAAASAPSGEAPPAPDGTFQAAKRAKAVYDAKLAELAYKEKLGTLVDRKAVYDALFTLGKEMRNELLNLPNRLMPDIRAAKNDADATNMMYEALVEIMNKFAEFESRPLKVDPRGKK